VTRTRAVTERKPPPGITRGHGRSRSVELHRRDPSVVPSQEADTPNRFQVSSLPNHCDSSSAPLDKHRDAFSQLYQTRRPTSAIKVYSLVVRAPSELVIGMLHRGCHPEKWHGSLQLMSERAPSFLALIAEVSTRRLKAPRADCRAQSLAIGCGINYFHPMPDRRHPWIRD
jgi:hypothetical protein